MCPKHYHCEKCDILCDAIYFQCYLCYNYYCINCAKYKDKPYEICDICVKQLNESEWIKPNKELLKYHNR